MRTFEVPRSRVVQQYYDACGSVDRHNLLRQGVLSFESTWKTHSWKSRLFSTLFAICHTDAYLAWKYRHLHSTQTILQFSTTIFSQIFSQSVESVPKVHDHSVCRLVRCSTRKRCSAGCSNRAGRPFQTSRVCSCNDRGYCHPDTRRNCWLKHQSKETEES